ncbi:MAG: MFS transporter [Planctomycetes bacterium]|nr:MFS transporter [Planctomycetota bacterium]
MFIGPVRATLLGADPLIAGSMVTARAVTCCLTSFAISRFLTSRNSVRLLFLSTALYFGAALLGLYAANIGMLYLTSALAGLFMVVFSASFQVFIKDVEANETRPLSEVVGIFTFAWCVGMSFGPFITGFLMELGQPVDGVGLSTGWKYAYLAAAGIIFLTFCALIWIYRVTHEHLDLRLAKPSSHAGAANNEKGKPDLAWLGWIMAFFGCSTLGVIRAVFPSGVTRAGMPEWRSGLMMTMVAAFMGVFALVVSRRGEGQLYSGRGMLAIGGIGFAGFALYLLPGAMGWGIMGYAWPFYLASILTGCYSGVVYLYSGFHSLAHPERHGRNISLNESFLALGMITGTLGGGWMAKHHGFYPPFAIAAFLIVGLAWFQFFAHRRYAAKPFH